MNNSLHIFEISPFVFFHHFNFCRVFHCTNISELLMHSPIDKHLGFYKFVQGREAVDVFRYFSVLRDRMISLYQRKKLKAKELCQSPSLFHLVASGQLLHYNLLHLKMRVYNEVHLLIASLSLFIPSRFGHTEIAALEIVYKENTLHLSRCFKLP